jgi:hypothetical protein
LNKRIEEPAMGIRLGLSSVACALVVAAAQPASSMPAAGVGGLARSEAMSGTLVEKAEFYRNQQGEVRYRYVRPDYPGPYFFAYRGYAYPYNPGYTYRLYRGELRPSDRPYRVRLW